MLVNLTDVFTSEGKEKTLEVSIEMDTFKSYGVEYSILEKTPVTLTLSYVSENRAKVCGKAEVVLDMQCDRCLKPVSNKVILDFEREISPRMDENSQIDEEDDLDLMEGYSLNTEILIYNELLMNQPEKVLCKDDCKGICMVCGHDLNDGECGCDTFVPDPRMAVLQDILNANKEV